MEFQNVESSDDILEFFQERFVSSEDFGKFEESFQELLKVLGDQMAPVSYTTGQLFSETASLLGGVNRMDGAMLLFKIDVDCNPGFLFLMNDQNQIINWTHRDPSLPAEEANTSFH